MQYPAVARILPALLALSAAALAGCSPDTLYELTATQPAVQFPRDEAPHSSSGEWWYYTGRLTTDDNRSYGVQTVIFHRTLIPLSGLAGGYLAHYAVLDEASGGLTCSQTRFLPTLDFTPPQGPGFDLQTPIVQMQGLDGHDHIQAAMCDGRLALDLHLTDQRGPIVHGQAGYVPYGLNQDSFYYSRPIMKAAGTLTVDDQPRPVTGTLWFDRQWGTDLRNPWLKWDWFSLRLDDGTCIMLFVFRDAAAPLAFGTCIPPAGDPIPLPADAFTIHPTARWRSPRTLIRYPVSWDITIPSQGLTLTVSAVTSDQEFDARFSTLNIYWEGLCTITGTRTPSADPPAAPQPQTGSAYVELTNYTFLD